MQGNHIVKNRYIRIPVPLDDVIESGIDLDGVIQTYTVDGKIIIENAITDDIACDEDCENCPFFDPGCEDEEDCDDCPCCCPECGGCMCKASMAEGEDGDEKNLSGSR